MTEETASGAGDTSRARRTLYVGGLAEQVDVKTLTAAFIPFGEINDVQIPMDNVESACILQESVPVVVYVPRTQRFVRTDARHNDVT